MRLLALSLLSLSLWSCAKFSTMESGMSSVDNGGFGSNPSQPNDGYEPPPLSSSMEPLAWESSVNGSSSWSNHIYKVIQEEETQMLGQNVADDVETFCPRYRSLNDDQRLNFWGQLFAGMAKYESGWKPTSRMVETTMDDDPVTGKQVASEGLLQLSYQDQLSYRMDCGFDWNKDRYLSDKDPRKTILDPYKNLRCGIKIMARQLKNKRAIALSSGVYWAVLKVNGKYTKIPQISAMTKQLTFCR